MAENEAKKVQAETLTDEELDKVTGGKYTPKPKEVDGEKKEIKLLHETKKAWQKMT